MAVALIGERLAMKLPIFAPECLRMIACHMLDKTSNASDDMNQSRLGTVRDAVDEDFLEHSPWVLMCNIFEMW